MTTTTIKVTTETRDRIAEIAREQGKAANSVVEMLLDDYLWRRQVDLAVRQMRSMTAKERAEYLAEVEEWDSTLLDGLDKW